VGRGRVRTELDAELTDGVLVVGLDAQHDFGAGVQLLDLVELVLVVEGHCVDAALAGVLDHGRLC